MGNPGDLPGDPNGGTLNVGLITRTEIDMQPVGAVRHVEHRDALASGSHPSFIAGGERHVQRETVKAFCQSLGWLSAPGGHVRHVALPGPDKPSTERTTMQASPKVSPDSADIDPLDAMGNGISDAIVILRTISLAMANSYKNSSIEEDFFGCLCVAIDRLKSAQKAEELLHEHFKIEPHKGNS